MAIAFTPIGYIENTARDVPRHCSVSDLEGTLAVLPRYEAGLTDIKVGQRLVVLFHFHRSAAFTDADLRQARRTDGRIKGVFSICSPQRPNAIGLSVVEVLAIDKSRIRVKGIDMLDGTPILDIKPYVDLQSHEHHGTP